jgi:hypothetical protein
MTIFRWVIGGLAALMISGALFSLLIYLIFKIPLWVERARRLRHWTWLILLLWFIVEIWIRVFGAAFAS